MENKPKTNKRKTTQIHIQAESDKIRAVRLVESIPADGTMVVNIKPDDELRTNLQRRLQHVWYKQISEEEITKASKKWTEQYCKLTFGVPILVRDNESFAAWWAEYSIKINYEQQIATMEFLPITRLFGVRQNIEYLNEMELHYADQGIVLKNKDDLYWESIGYSRRK